MIKAVSIDWENTCSTKKNVSWPTQKIGQLSSILRTLWQIKGVCVFLNTGRPAPYAEAALQALGIITNIPSITENGGILYYPKTGAFKLNPAINEQKIVAFKNVKDALITMVEKIGGLKELGKEYCFSTNPPPGIEMADYFIQIKSGVTANLGKSIWNLIEATYSQSAVDITIKGINKESGLKFWCHEQDIKIEQIAAIGDSRGDWPVLEKVALPMCPANATPETKNLIKERSGYISSFPATLGTIDCIGQLGNDRFVSNMCENVIREWEISFPMELVTLDLLIC